MATRLGSLLAGFALWGCSSPAPDRSSSQAPDQQQVTRQPRTSVRIQGIAIRVSVRGGPPRLYRLPTLAEIASGLRGRLPVVERVVGVDPETEYLYARTDGKELLGYDLESGRVDTVASGVEQAVLGPDGTLFTVDSSRRVTSVARRARRAWPQPLGGVPSDLFGSTDQRLVAVLRQDPPRLVVAAPDQPPDPHPIQLGGHVAASLWGDLVAIAGDSGVTLVDPLARREPGFVRLPDHPRALAFSPAGHLIYVARRTVAGLAVIDRFEREEIDGVALPGPAATIRLDPYGRWLLARPHVGDSVWIVDLPVKTLAGGLETTWRVDLPAIAPDGTLLLRAGDDVVAYRVDSLRRTGRVAGAGGDLWVLTTWRPRGGAGPGPAETAQAVPAEAGGAEGPLYVQVSVSQNQAWSAEMAQQLARAGLAALVLSPPPDRPDDGFRVVLGPYPTRAQAEAIGRKLGRPFWIYQPGQ